MCVRRVRLCAVDAPVEVWIYRVLCLVLPFSIATAMEHAAEQWSSDSRWALAATGWLLWVLVTLAGWYRRSIALAAARCTVPIIVLTSNVILTRATSTDWSGWIGLIAVDLMLIVAFQAKVGEWFANGSSYGAERRMVLRPPLMMSIAAPIVWMIGGLLGLVGVRALVDDSWLWGAVCLAIGAGIMALVILTALRLLDRVAVFVPAGITIIDSMSLTDPTLLPAARTESLSLLGLTETLSPDDDGDAGDLGRGSIGRSVVISLMLPVELGVLGVTASNAEMRAATDIRIVPTRAAAFVAAAESLSYKVS